MNIFEIDMYDEITPGALKLNRLLAESIHSYEFTCSDCPNAIRYPEFIKCRFDGAVKTMNIEKFVFDKSQCPYYTNKPFVIVAFRGGKDEILDTMYAGTLSELIDMFYTSGMFFADEKVPAESMNSIFDLVNYCNKYTDSDANFSFYPLRDKGLISKINLYADLLAGNTNLDDHLVKYVLKLIRNDTGNLLKYFEKYEAVYDNEDKE